MPVLATLRRALLRCLLLSTWLMPESATAHAHGAYSQRTRPAVLDPDWMGRLHDDVPLNMLSIPGTHNSMSRHGGPSVATQSLTLRAQLHAGIRFFDIRLRLVDNDLWAYHHRIHQRASYGDILREMVLFLRRYPTEVVFMRVREEYQAFHSNIPFHAALERAEHAHAAGHMRQPDAHLRLRHARGRIIRFHEETYQRMFAISDDWALSSNWALHDKWQKIKRALQEANAMPDRNTAFSPRVTYLSGSGSAFPYFVASGHVSSGDRAPRLSTGLTTPAFANYYPDFPRTTCFIGICTISFEGTNVLAQQYMEREGLTHVGTVMADFPGPDLIRTIISTNYPRCRYREPRDQWAYIGRQPACR